MSDHRTGGVDDAGPDLAESPPHVEPGAQRPPRSVARNIVSLATSQGITWGLALLWTFFVPRLIGPEQMGVLTIATSVTALVAVVLSITTKEFLVREIVSNRSAASRLLTLALLLRLATLPAVYLTALVYAHVAELDDRAMTVLYVVAAATVCTMMAEPALATFQATERMQFIAYTDVTNKSLQTLGGILLAAAGFGVISLAGLGLGVALFTLVIALVWAHRLIGLRARPAAALPVIRRAAPYWFVAVFYVAYLWTDAVLLGVLATPEVVGWYGAAMRLFTTMMFVAVIISTASLPRLVAANSRSTEDLYLTARRPFEWVLILGLPIGVGLACTADGVVRLLYGVEYTGAVPALAILGLCLPVMYVNIQVAQVFVASGRPLVMGRILAAAAVFNVAANLLLIPYTEQRWGNGAIGAAMALLLTELCQAVLALAIVGRRLLSRATVLRVAKAAVAAGGMAALLMVLPNMPLPLEILLGAFAFLGLVVLFRLPTPDEVATARLLVARVHAAVRRGRLASRGGKAGPDRP